MNFLRNPGWIGSLHRTVAATPVTPVEPGPWTPATPVSFFDFEDGGANGSVYTSATSNILASSDYAVGARVWVDAGGVTGKSIRYPTNSEVPGGDHSRYRAWLQANNTYLSGKGMLTEGRLTYDLLIPPTPSFRGMGGTDAQVWWFGGIIDGTLNSRFMFFGFELDSQTLGVWNQTSSSFVSEAATATLALGGTPAPGWYAVDFRYRIDATTGYMWLKLGSFDPIYISGQNTSMIGERFLYALCCGSRTLTTTDLTYFGSIDNVQYYSPA